MKINKKNLSKYVLDDLNEIDCIYFNPKTYQLCLEADNGCVIFSGCEKDGVANIYMEHSNTPKINKNGCSEVITNAFIADFLMDNLSISIYFENDMVIIFRLEPIIWHDDSEPYAIDNLKLVAYYEPIEEDTLRRFKIAK